VVFLTCHSSGAEEIIVVWPEKNAVLGSGTMNTVVVVVVVVVF
jgi:hypothetical protein